MIPGDAIVAVCGFARSGCSLVLQMLRAGGADVSGTYPSFDVHAFDRHSLGGFVADNLGRAIKVLERRSVNVPLPPGAKYKCIWVNRDHKQQAKSMLKVKCALDPSFTGNSRATRNALASSFGRDKPRAIGKLWSAGADILQWNFEDILKDPLASAHAFATHLQLPLDEARMMRVPCAREAACLPFMLEIELLSSLAAHSAKIQPEPTSGAPLTIG